MPLASLFALALMVAEPAGATPAPAPAAKPDAARAAVAEEPIPAGAPSDDYGFVNWCTGALAGHMALYTQVKPQLDTLPDPRPSETAALDAEQQKAGREYLELYKKATDAAEKASPRAIADRGATEKQHGASIWDAARNTTDRKAAMWTYLGWELPGRCETAAERLYEKSLLSAQALGIDLTHESGGASDKPAAASIDSPAPKARTATSSTPPIGAPPANATTTSKN